MRTILGRKEKPILHFAHPVAWFRYGPIVFGQSRLFAITARSPVWRARMSEASFIQLLNKRRLWSRHILRPSAENGEVAIRMAADLLIRDSERRCAAVLLRLSGHRFTDPEDTEPAEVPITQDELAGAANLSRTSVRTMLQRLAAPGLVEQGYRGVVVRDTAALRAFVNER